PRGSARLLQGSRIWLAYFARLSNGLRNADLTGADLRGASLRNADLTGADLRGASLHGAILTGARYDARTRWPPGFDPKRHGAKLVKPSTAHQDSLPAWTLSKPPMR